MSRIIFTVLVVVIAGIVGTTAQTKELTLENIYKHGLIQTEGAGQFRWIDGGERYTRTEYNSESRGTEIVSYEPDGKNRQVLVTAAMLTPKGSTRPLSVRDYQWSEQKDKLLIFTNTRRVWRYHTRGDYWVLNLKTLELQRLGKTLPEARLMFAKFSPDGSKVAYVCEQNIYVEDLDSKEIQQLTSDGGNNIINGTFDWVYEEEFSCRDGFRWSNDGNYIAFWQSDTEGTGTFYMMNNLDSNYSTPIPLPYPKAGTTNSAVKTGVVNLKNKQISWFNIPGDPRNNYLPRMEFIPGSNKVLIQQMNRLQNTNKVWIGDVETMKIKNVFTEKNDTWLETNDDIRWMDKGKSFTWMSDKSGFMHLYKISIETGEMTALTTGNYEIENLVHLDFKKGVALFTGATSEFTERALYSIKLDGKSDRKRITPKELKGHNKYDVSPDGKWAVHAYENTTTPPVISMISLPKHKTERIITDNARAKDKYNSMGLNPKEFIKVDLGDVVLDAWMIKPADFDASKKYPVIFYVYGEPASSTVQNNWSGGDLWHQYMAQQGYVVMSIENRGANVPRGREWRKCIYGEVGVLSSHDQAAAAKKVCDMFSFVDRERLGIWGWSGGGSMTLNCMFRYPEVYKTGIAVAFVADQKLYDTIYQERYMGTPQGNPEGYKKGSPIHFAAGLKGELLLIHGSGDDNVHYQNCEQLMDELIRLDKLFYAVPYPMRSHSIRERENTSLHLRRTMEKFWKEKLL